MQNWKFTTLSNVANIVPGYAFKGNDFGKTGTPIIKIKDIIPPYIDIKNADRIDISKYKNIENFILVKNDIVVAMTGATIGKVGRYTYNNIAYLNQRVAKILPKKDIINNFLYYCVSSLSFHQHIQNNIDSNSAQENISASSIGRFSFFLPPLAEQKAIAAVLSSLDDKIDLLHRQNATLERMAETIFQRIFISEHQKCKTITLDKWIIFNPKRILKKGVISSYIEMSNLNTQYFHPASISTKEFSSGTKFKNGDTLLARITPCLENGKSCFVNFLNRDEIGWGSTEYLVMRPVENLHPFFAYCLIKSEDFRAYAELCLSGSSGRQRINIDHLKQYELLDVDINKINRFNKMCSVLEPKLLKNYLQIRTLEKLRDTLLPKLMSGEVRVRVAE